MTVLDDEQCWEADRRFLGLDIDVATQRGEAVITPHLQTPDGRFYGGGGLALCIAAMEACTHRRVRWATAQFAGTTREAARISLQVHVEAHGKSSSQVRVTGTTDAGVLFQAIGVTGVSRAGTPPGQFVTMPQVPSPDDCPPLWPDGIPNRDGPGHLATSDSYDASGGDVRITRVWTRLKDHDVARPAMLGFVADLLPLAMMRASGATGSASLDNTLRVGAPVASPWVLLDLRPDLINDGYGHGTAYLWSPEGHLLGLATQSVILREGRR